MSVSEPLGFSIGNGGVGSGFGVSSESGSIVFPTADGVLRAILGRLNCRPAIRPTGITKCLWEAAVVVDHHLNDVLFVGIWFAKDLPFATFFAASVQVALPDGNCLVWYSNAAFYVVYVRFFGVFEHDDIEPFWFVVQLRDDDSIAREWWQFEDIVWETAVWAP